MKSLELPWALLDMDLHGHKTMYTEYQRVATILKIAEYLLFD